MKDDISFPRVASIRRRFLAGSIAALLAGLAVFNPSSASATITKENGPATFWLGQTDGTWTGFNWATNSTGTTTTLQPTSADDVTFSATGAANQTTTLGADFNIHSLTISDTTAVTIGGTNTLTISGASGTTGLTVDGGGNAGLLTVSANLNLTGVSNTITVNNSAGAVISGTISGSIGLIKDGTSTLVVSGANNYTGATAILDGTLQLGTDNTLPTGTTVTLNRPDGSGSPLLDLNGHNQAIAGLIFVAPNENETVDLNGGRLTVKGNIQLVDNTSVPGNAEEAIIQDSTGGGVLDLGGAVRTITVAGQNVSQQELTISVPIANGGVIINAIPSSDSEIGNPAAGVYFSAVNTYAGGTTVAQGWLSVTVNGALPVNTINGVNVGTDLTLGTANSSLTGQVDLQGTTQTINSLQLAAGNTGGTGNFITSTSGGEQSEIVRPQDEGWGEGCGGGGGATLIVDSETVDSTYAGLITGPITLIKIGPRTFTLTAANDYVGSTGIGGGVLQITNDNNLGDLSNFVYLYNNGTLRILADVTTNRTLVLDPVPTEDIKPLFAVVDSVSNPGGTIDTNGFSLTWNGNITGSGQLTKTGLGTLTLTNASNDYLGGTAINGGVLAISTDSNLGDPSGGLSFANGGILQFLASVTSNRAITLNAGGGGVDTNGFDSTLGGNMSGPGSFAKLGAGTLTLLGNNTYSGATMVNAGTLQAGSSTAFSPNSAFQINTGATLDLAGNSSSIGSLGDGPGGGGTVTSSVAGPISLTTGNDGTNTTFGGVIQNGAGVISLTKTGNGSLTLSGNNTYTGNTTVAGGALFVDGSIASANTFVQPGALIGGHGTIGGNLLNNGIVSPGNSPGTLTATGNFTQSSGGLFLVQIGGLALPLHDLLAIGGSASLNGALQLQQLSGFRFHLGDKVTFLTAAGGVSGTFSSVSNPFANDTLVGVEVIYLPNSVLAEGVQIPITSIPSLTPNQHAVATALDDSITDPRNAKIIAHLDDESIEKVLRDLDRIAPDELTSIYQIAVSQAKIQTDNLQRRLEDIRAGSNGFSAAGFAMNGSSPGYSGPLGVAGMAQGPDGKGGKMALTPAPDNRWGVFVTGTGEWASVGDTSNSQGYDLTNAGFTLGVDYKVTDHFVIGLAAGYDYSSADLVSGGRVTVDGGKLALYASYFTGTGFYADASVGGGYNSYDTHRAALEGFANGSTTGGEFNAMFGTGYDWKVGAVTFGPTAGFEYTYVGLGNFDERGSLAPLAFPNQHQESIRSTVGAKATCDWKIGGVLVKPQIRVAWQHEYGDATFGFDSRLANGAGPEFLVHGPATGRDSLLLSGGFAIQCSERISTYVYYDGELARQNYHASGVSGGFRVEF